MSASFFDLTKYAATGIALPQMTVYDKLKALAMFGGSYPISTITGLPPISFLSDGTPLTAYTIIGNEQQTGTPTADEPIQPEECGDRTANLFDESAPTVNAYINNSGEVVPSASDRLYDYMPFDNNATYSVTNGDHSGVLRFAYYDSGKNFISRTALSLSASMSSTITTPASCAYVRISLDKTMTGIMLNTGSTAKPYEPYGYKITVTVGGTTYNVYLQEPIRKIGNYADVLNSSGTVTRRIRRLVLDGTEAGWGTLTADASVGKRFSFLIPDAMQSDLTVGAKSVCSHFKLVVTGGTYNTQNSYAINDSSRLLVAMDASYTTVDDFKAFLADEYSNGTPVTVWCVLSSAQTDSADAPAITPAAGSNTLTVGTTLQPSSVSITGKIKEV